MCLGIWAVYWYSLRVSSTYKPTNNDDDKCNGVDKVHVHSVVLGCSSKKCRGKSSLINPVSPFQVDSVSGCYRGSVGE